MTAVLEVLDAEVERARASARSTRAAWQHSLRDAKGRLAQLATAEAAEARLEGMLAARTAVADLVEVADRAQTLLPDSWPMARELREALAPFADPRA